MSEMCGKILEQQTERLDGELSLYKHVFIKIIYAMLTPMGESDVKIFPKQRVKKKINPQLYMQLIDSSQVDRF